MLLLWIAMGAVTVLAGLLTLLTLPVVLGLGIAGTFVVAFGLSVLLVGVIAALLAYGFSGLRDLA